MTENPTTGELYKAKAVTEEDVVGAVDAFMADQTMAAFRFGNGYQIDLAAAVEAHGWARAAMAADDVIVHVQRTAVRTAILLARPEKA